MNFGVCVLIMNEEGKILSVSRKDDKNDIGLPGGKIEPGETPAEAALRELFEETGYKVIDGRFLQMIYHSEADGKLAVTYQIPFGAIKASSGAPSSNETGVVAWVNPSVLTTSKTFGEYNRNLFKAVGVRDPGVSTRDDFRDYGIAKKKKS